MTLAILALGVCRFAYGQNTASSDQGETVVLPTFTIKENLTNPYQSAQATSTSRVAVAIQDIPQSVSVVTNQFMSDTQGGRMLDSAKYTTSVVESSLPVGGDRYTMRGFQISAEFVDGVNVGGLDSYNMSLPPYNIERLEVIKGANAILVPGGSPGGVINPITKSPNLTKDSGTINIEGARYIGSNVNLDVNRVLGENMAGRLVAAYWDSHGFTQDLFRRGYTLAPSFAYRLGEHSTLVVKGEFIKNLETNFAGLPLDPSVGTDVSKFGYARIDPGFPRDYNTSPANATRRRNEERIVTELTSQIGGRATMRLFLMADHVVRHDEPSFPVINHEDHQTDPSLAALPATGSRDFSTGNYVPYQDLSGVRQNLYYASGTAIQPYPYPGATAVPTGLPSPLWDRYSFGSIQGNYIEMHELHLKNDYAVQLENRWVKTTTITGLSANVSESHYVAFGQASGNGLPSGTNAPLYNQGPGILGPTSTLTSGSIDTTNLAARSDANEIYGSPNPLTGQPFRVQDKKGIQKDLQMFVYERATFLKDHLILTGGLSRVFGELSRVDNSGNYYNNFFTQTLPKTLNNDINDVSWGVVVKPIEPVSLFYGFNRASQVLPSFVSAGDFAKDYNGGKLEDNTLFRPQVGAQKEVGIKTSLLDNRLTASLAGFDIHQSNFRIPIGTNYVFIDVVSRGWECETSYAVTKGLTILANFTGLRTRDANGVRLRSVPDHAGHVYLDYKFTSGQLKGLGFNVGLDYQGSVAGDAASGVTNLTDTGTSAGVVKAQVANQPTFFIDSRTVVSAGISYRWKKHWNSRLTVDNVTNKEYIQGALNRNQLYPGDPRSYKLSVGYDF